MTPEDPGPDKVRERLGEAAEWKARSAGAQDPRELLRQVTQIGICMSYDLIDKLRYWEKRAQEMPEEELPEQIRQMSGFLEKLKTAYLHFADDF
jgi:hypothetical protein